VTDASPRVPESSPQERFLHPLWFFFVTRRLPAAREAWRNSVGVHTPVDNCPRLILSIERTSMIDVTAKIERPFILIGRS
jgi:hypothetical protein